MNQQTIPLGWPTPNFIFVKLFVCLFSQNTTMLIHLHIAYALTSYSAELSSCSKDHMLSKYEKYYIILCSGVPSNRVESMFIKCCKFSYIGGNC